jgi:hypothetical protein
MHQHVQGGLSDLRHVSSIRSKGSYALAWHVSTALAVCKCKCVNVHVCCNCCRMITSGVAGLLCLGAFCFLQTFISVYRGRLVSTAQLQTHVHVQQCQRSADVYSMAQQHASCSAVTAACPAEPLIQSIWCIAAVSSSGNQASCIHWRRHCQILVSLLATRQQ